MITQNKDSWVLFQIYDEVTERWSPPYSAPSISAMRLDIKELAQKQRNRPIMVRTIGFVCDNDFEALNLVDEWYNREEEVKTDEVSAARANV